MDIEYASFVNHPNVFVLFSMSKIYFDWACRYQQEEFTVSVFVIPV
jgi:hypothetical protein